MDLVTVGEVIAVRVLLVACGPAREVNVSIGKPTRFDGSCGFYCPFQVAGLGDEKVRYAGGTDAVQAIQLCFRMIGAYLQSFEEVRDGGIRWEGGERGHHGFPVS
jgi:hypothetical protein